MTHNGRTLLFALAAAERIPMATCFLPDRADHSIGVFAEGGEAKIVSLEVHELKSAWTE